MVSSIHALLAIVRDGEGQTKGTPQEDFSLPWNWSTLLQGDIHQPRERFVVQIELYIRHTISPMLIA